MVFVKDEGRFYTVYKRANGTHFIVKNGKRKTIRKDKKRYNSKIACSSTNQIPCKKSQHCSWTVGKGCRAKGLPEQVRAQQAMVEVLGLGDSQNQPSDQSLLELLTSESQ
ncbi:MAG: hypothetical protein K0U52_06285 [Gammaproteobacteria bacterium]|nr:hypothetical protein [Gammaproteobacteria bacterium]